MLSSCKSPKMPPGGKGERSILFVGEAPGEKEDIRGTQFVGKTGKYLQDVLRSLPKPLRMDLDDGWKANAICCRPAHNKIEDIHINSCRPLLLKTVRDKKPSVIVLLGGSAVKGLLPLEREADIGAIGRWVGWTIPSHEHGAWVCPTYHPSYLLRQNDKVLDRLFEAHLQKALQLEGKPIGGEPLSELRKRVERVPGGSQARAKLKDLRRAKGVLAFDFETNRLKPDHPKSRIRAASFCLSPDSAFAVEVTDDLLPLLSEVLRNPRLKKVAANLKNEERWTRRLLGHGVANWHWDTMLAAHVLDNRGRISGLKFQSFVRFGVVDYDRTVQGYLSSQDREGFNRVGDCPLDELLLYNGLDSLLTFRLMEVQRVEIGMKS